MRRVLGDLLTVVAVVLMAMFLIGVVNVSPGLGSALAVALAILVVTKL